MLASMVQPIRSVTQASLVRLPQETFTVTSVCTSVAARKGFRRALSRMNLGNSRKHNSSPLVAGLTEAVNS